jgi:hypothetical protein
MRSLLCYYRVLKLPNLGVGSSYDVETQCFVPVGNHFFRNQTVYISNKNSRLDCINLRRFDFDNNVESRWGFPVAVKAKLTLDTAVASEYDLERGFLFKGKEVLILSRIPTLTNGPLGPFNERLNPTLSATRLEQKLPSFSDQIPAKAMVFVLVYDAKSCLPVNMARGVEFALCPQHDLSVTGQPRKSHTFAD